MSWTAAAVAAVVVSVAPLTGQDAPKPAGAPRGGMPVGNYGEPPSEAWKPEQPPAWIAEQQKRIDDLAAGVIKSREKVDATWGEHAADRMDRLIVDALGKAGVSADDIARFYKKDDRGYGLDWVYQPFFDKARDVLWAARVEEIGNPGVLLGGARPYKYANRAAVEAALAWLDEDLKLMRFYEERLPTLLDAAAAEIVARTVNSVKLMRVNERMATKGGPEEGDAGRSVVDPVNVRARAARKQLDAEWGFLNDQDAQLRGYGPAYDRLVFTGNLHALYRFEWMVSHQDDGVVRRTQKMLSILDAAERLESHSDTLTETMSRHVYVTEPRLRFDAGPTILGVYRAHLGEVRQSLARLSYRFVVDGADIGKIDEGMAKLAAKMPEMDGARQEMTDRSKRQRQLDAEIEPLELQMAVLGEQAQAARKAKDDDNARKFFDQADLVRQKADKVRAASTAFDDETRGRWEKFNDTARSWKLFEAIPTGKVTWVQVVTPPEEPPRRYIGENIVLLPRQIHVPVAGTPMVVRFAFDEEPKDRDKPRMVELTIGGEPVKLRARLTADLHTWQSDPFMLVPPPPEVGGGGTGAKPDPGVVQP